MAFKFDADYYKAQRGDVYLAYLSVAGTAGAGSWPEFAEAHYNNHGWRELANPHPNFNTEEYLDMYPDIRDAGINPFQHFLSHGVNEGRAPSASFPKLGAEFNAETYLDANPDLVAAGITTPEQAYAHFVLHGQFEGRAGAPAVDNGIPGETFYLTQGLDTITGTANNDTINAYAFNSVTGAEVTTLNSVDVIDGGAGVDTLNIEVKDDGAGGNYNGTLQGTIKNVEIINIDQSQAFAAIAVDASKLGEAAQQIWQIGQAGAVTKLGASTTAGFKNISSGALSVEAADNATSVSVALNNVDDQSTLGVSATATGTLNSVSVKGSVVDAASPADGIDPIATTITVGKDVETLTLDTEVAVDLTVIDGAGTKVVKTVNAAASKGSIDYTAAATVANIATGSGDDTVALQTAFTNTVKSASLSTGDGKDALTISVDNSTNNVSGVSVSVDAGAGDDSIDINTTDGATNRVALDVKAGEGDDTVTLTIGLDKVATTDVIDGGAGTDTVVVAGKTLDAEDYIILRDVITNFEAIKFTGGTDAVVDASRLASYKDFTFAGNGGDAITKVGAGTSLTTAGDLTATHAGYSTGANATDIEGDETYAGTLSVKSTNQGTITAYAETLDLTVAAQEGAAAHADVVVQGDVKAIKVTLASNVDDADAPTADVLATVDITIDDAVGAQQLLAVESITLSGNGSANVENIDGAALATVDASALNSVDFNGDVAAGLKYTTSNASVAETIKLGAGLDDIYIEGSTYLKMDTITGLTLVDDGTGAVDTAVSDDLSVFVSGAQETGFKKTTVTGTTLDTALIGAASSADDALVFSFGGDTYVYIDDGDDILSDTDVLIKLTGGIDLDLLVDALNN